MLKVKISDVTGFKAAVATAYSLVSPTTSNSNEKCIALGVKSNLLNIIAVENGSHKFILQMPVEVDKENEGVAFINGATLQQMTKNIPTSNGDLEIFVDTNGLNYRVNVLGIISEALYSNQDAFRGILFYESRLVNLAANCPLRKIASVAANEFTDTCLINFSSTGISIYDKVSETGFVKYSLTHECLQDFSIYVKKNLLKNLNSLGDEVDVSYCAAPSVIKFESEYGSLILLGIEVKEEEYEVVDWIESLNPVGKVVVQNSDLMTAIQWQSYGATVENGITLKTEESNLLLQAKLPEASRVSYQDCLNFGEATFSVQGLTRAIKAIKEKELVNLSLIELLIGEQTIKVLLIQSWETPEEASSILYEQTKLV